MQMDLSSYGIQVSNVLRNSSPALLYEEGIRYDHSRLTSSGAILACSGSKTGRSPRDKRIVEQSDSRNDVWWGDINIPLDEPTFEINRQRAIDFLNLRERLYVVDGYAGWDPRYRLKIRVICARPYHALFMHNMLIRPTEEELENFDRPSHVIFNAGEFPANPNTRHMTSRTTIDLNFSAGEFVILGTEYAGEMKKGVFTLMNYLMPKQGVLSMHCAANEGRDGDTTLFFGLSGTGKTTLSADPRRKLIGDDEHCWSDEGIFNIEGGCYAKCIHLAPEKEPEIFQAIRFGAILENVVLDELSRDVRYNDDSITENTRVSYPIEFIPNAKIPCIGGHPRNIVLLTCDAFGVLPPVSRLTTAQAMYHFINGYTAKVAGTEQGVTEPQATFSACYGAAFLVLHPTVYATMLAEKIRRHGSQVWLVNTGWSGGSYGNADRISLAHTRAIIDAIHSGELDCVPTEEDPLFGLHIPLRCPCIPADILLPWKNWSSQGEYQRTASRLAELFHKNFAKYADRADDETLQAGPNLEVYSS